MAQLSTKLKLYAKNNGKTLDFAFGGNVRLEDNGSGAFIKEWNVSGLDKPTNDQLATYESLATTEENNSKVKTIRRNAYPEIGDQLDMLWHSIDEDPALKQKYFKFYEAIKAVKAKYPK